MFPPTRHWSVDMWTVPFVGVSLTFSITVLADMKVQQSLSLGVERFC